MENKLKSFKRDGYTMTIIHELYEIPDIIIRMDEKEVYCLTLFTVNDIKEMMEKCKKDGDCLSGKYYWASDMLIVENTKIELVLEVCDEIVKTGLIKKISQKYEDTQLE
ncbi:MAG: hypothetical protein U0Z75_04625 [Deinococcaceae bacterium]